MRAATAAGTSRRGPSWARSGTPEHAAADGSRRGPAWARAVAGDQPRAGTADLLVVGLWLLTRVVLLVVSLNPRLYSAALFGDIRFYGAKVERDRKSTRLNSSHSELSRMPSSA